MDIKRRAPEVIAGHLAAIEQSRQRGACVADACAAQDIAVASYYRWQAKYGGRPAVARAREAARAVILEAALARFSEHGFGASIEAIASSAGVARQTIYNVFGDKDRLFIEVVQTLYHRLVPPVAVDDALPLPEFLSACGWHMIDLVIDPRAVTLMRISIGEFGRHPELARVAYALRSAPFAPNLSGTIARRLEQEAAAGRIDALDCRLAAEAFIGSFAGHARHRALVGAAPCRAELHRRLDFSIRLLLKGIGF